MVEFFLRSHVFLRGKEIQSRKPIMSLRLEQTKQSLDVERVKHLEDDSDISR